MKMTCQRLFVSIFIPLVGIFLLMLTGHAQLQETAPVAIKRVIPSKILYRFNEQATVTVWIKNNSAETQVGTLIFREFWDIKESREIGRNDISIAPGEEKRDISFNWNVGNIMYGRAVRVEFVQNGQVIAAGDEFFSVADDWLRVNIISGWTPVTELGLFETYHNHEMHFAFGACDFSELSPDEDAWYSGQNGHQISKKGLIEQISDRQKSGIKSSLYASNGFRGPAGYEFARQHPEWAVRKENGSFLRPFGGSLSPLDMSRSISEKPSVDMGGVVDFYDAKAVKFGAEEIIRSIRMFGWDGIFFDGFYYLFPGYSWDGQPTPHGKNPNEISARNIRLCREIIRKEFPHFAFTYNISHSWQKGPFEQTWSNSGGMETFVELSSDSNSGTLYEFQGAALQEPTEWNIWRNIYEGYVNRQNERIVGEWAPQAAGAVMNSGYIFNYDYKSHMTEKEFIATRDVWTLANHIGSFFLATQIHPNFITSTSFRPILQFMTRYSALLWDQRVKKVADSSKIVKINSNRPIWWQECVYRKEGEGYVDYLVHLINTPEKETVDIRAAQDPPAADVIVHLTPAEKIGSVKAYAMRPYNFGELPAVPVQSELTTEVKGPSVQVNVPPFRYYMLVAVRVRR